MPAVLWSASLPALPHAHKALVLICLLCGLSAAAEVATVSVFHEGAPQQAPDASYVQNSLLLATFPLYCLKNSFSGNLFLLSSKDGCSPQSPLGNSTSAAESTVVILEQSPANKTCSFGQRLAHTLSWRVAGVIVLKKQNDTDITSVSFAIPCVTLDLATAGVLLGPGNVSVSFTPTEPPSSLTPGVRPHEEVLPDLPPVARNTVFGFVCALGGMSVLMYLYMLYKKRTMARRIARQRELLFGPDGQQMTQMRARIAQLPIIEYKLATAEADRAACAVCLEDIQDGVQVRRLHCMHVFHVPCIDRWLTTAPNCPLCKADAFPARQRSVRRHHYAHPTPTTTNNNNNQHNNPPSTAVAMNPLRETTIDMVVESSNQSNADSTMVLTSVSEEVDGSENNPSMHVNRAAATAAAAAPLTETLLVSPRASAQRQAHSPQPPRGCACVTHRCRACVTEGPDHAGPHVCACVDSASTPHNNVVTAAGPTAAAAAAAAVSETLDHVAVDLDAHLHACTCRGRCVCPAGAATDGRDDEEAVESIV